MSKPTVINRELKHNLHIFINNLKLTSMKKLSLFAIAMAAVVFTACTGNKKNAQEQVAESEKSFEQEQLEASIKLHIDSIAADLGKLKQLPFVQENNGGLTLTKEEKQVKPDYLLNPSVAEETTTLAEKYRIISALNVDKKIAALYEMPTDDFDKAISKLAADINDPSFKILDDANSVFETTSALYDSMSENGRINQFWQIASAALVEQLYIVNQNSDKFLSVFNDEAASNVTYRIILILDALDRLAGFDPELKPVAEALAPLKALNATNLDELKSQLAEAKDNIAAARKALVK